MRPLGRSPTRSPGLPRRAFAAFAARLCLAGLLIVAGSHVPQAQASDPNVDAMGQTFMRNIPTGWLAVTGTWQYVDITDCNQNNNCYGNNPSTPYGYPILPSPNGNTSQLQLNPNQAVVVFLRTPPSMRYFSFTQYLFSRSGATYPLFASLSQSLNHKQFVTLQSATPGQNVFDQYAVVVWAADANARDGVLTTLAKQGIAQNHVNVIAAPLNLPLFMGYGSQYDTFTLLMRTALPDQPSAWEAYKNELPVFVIKTGPVSSTPVTALPSTGYRSDVSGIVEDPSLQKSLNKLIADIKSNYAARYAFTDMQSAVSVLTGWDCIRKNQKCNADTYDALYSRSANVQVTRLNDVAFVVGVNHLSTGKSLYINHTINDPANNTGVVAIDDPLLTPSSALYHAGVTRPRDPRVNRYRNLFAYAISYDCTGLQYCLTIPTPTLDNPVGLAPGAPFAIGGRSYVEPHTLVRPAAQEIVWSKVIVGARK